MAISSNVNQANLQSQQRLLQEQQQFEGQRRSQVFAASESQKQRDFTERQYNLKAGDKFLDTNVVQSFDEGQRSTLGDVTAVVYSDAQSKILDARKKITSGNSQTRIEGQMEMTRANNSIKQLAQDLMIAEADTEEAANGNSIPGPNSQLVKDVYRSNVEGITRVVSSESAEKGDGDKNEGRYIQYKNEAGEDQWISMDSYKKILRGLTPRQDVNAWLKSTSDNLEQDKSLTEATLKRQAVVSHVQNYLSDPQVVQALQHQFNVGTKEEVQRRLEDQLIGTKGTQQIRQPQAPAGRTPSFTDLTKSQDFSQRKFDILQGSNTKDVEASEVFLNQKLKGKATRSGPKEWNGITITDVEIRDGKILISGGDKVRELPWNEDQLNALYNEVRYTSEQEGKISKASAMGSRAQNFGAEIDLSQTAEDTGLDAEIQNIHSALTSGNKAGDAGIKNPEALITALKSEGKYAKALTRQVLGKPEFLVRVFDDKNVRFNQKDYDVRTSEGAQSFLNDLDRFVKASRGKDIQSNRLNNLPE